MSRSAWVMVLALAGCGVRESEVGESSAPDGPEVMAARRSCRSTVAPYQAPLQYPGARATIGGRDFSYFWRRKGNDVEVVIASLDARGELVITPVPVPYAASVAIGADPGGLVIVWVPLREKGTLLRVALAEDGSLRPGPPMPVPIPWGWPAKLTSDGQRATLIHTLASEQQTAGATLQYTIDLGSMLVIDSSTPTPGEERVCDAGGCTTIAMTRGKDGGGPGRLRVAGRAGTVEVEVDSTCPAHYVIEAQGERVVVAPGDPWRAIAVSATSVAEVKVDKGLTREAGCGSALYEFPLAARPGVQEGIRPRWLLRWDPRRRVFGRREALPDPAYDQTVRAQHVDGVIEVGWAGWSGMAHDPEHDPEGQRIYFKHWSFTGGVIKLLRPEADRWDAVDAVTLPLADVHGTFHEGYTPVILRNGVHAAVLLAPDGGPEDAWVVPYLQACPG